MVKLAVSSFAWPAGQDAAALNVLAAHGAAGVEVVPTRLAPDWAALTPELLRATRRRLDDAGLTVPALQSLFFGLPEWQVLGEASEAEGLRAHLLRIAEIAAALGAPVAVLGAARNRRDCGLSEGVAARLGAERLHLFATALEGTGLTLVLEPVPATYGCGFVTSAAAAERMVRLVDHPGLRLHLDVANAHLEGEAIGAAIARGTGLLTHFHASQPDLGDFASPLPGHEEAAAALRVAGYQGWVTVEMLDRGPDPLGRMAQALDVARGVYFS
jgi:D-psicose/D-tagatose/L-ribulose 3-epimerase